ncbi:MAG TPA: NUDIX domain-containing protein [Elusimicrobiota bacterium]|jgi:8-oxo-dGTP pyrophosphatase MutT (NUDIX family)|nr:NUDIX domain-containing protein [Elusimicrobiota bacterium]
MDPRALPKQFVATGFVVEDGKTLLLFHKKLRMWLPPGGHIEERETPEAALLREVREETGLEVEIVAEKRAPDPEDGKVLFLFRPRLVQLEAIDGKHEHIDLIYFCRPTGGTLRRAEAEADGLRWFTPEELRSPEVHPEVRDSALLAIRELSGEAAARR